MQKLKFKIYDKVTRQFLKPEEHGYLYLSLSGELVTYSWQGRCEPVNQDEYEIIIVGQEKDTEQEFKTVELCQEDICNLQVAYDKIYKITTDLDALELFTIKGIIDQFNKNGNR